MTIPVENTLPGLSSYEDLAGMIGLAALAPELSDDQVAEACSTARKYRLARLTVRPADLDSVVNWMRGSEVRVGAAIGYPYGGDTTAVKLYAVRDALQRGAKAIETVLSPGQALSRQFRHLESELIQMAQECRRAGAELTVAVNLAWLPADLRVIACRLAKRAEVDWLRAGTVFDAAPPSPEDLSFLASRLGDAVKLDAGPAVTSLEDVQRIRDAGAVAFQITRPEPLLDSWLAELKQRKNPAAV